MRLRLHRFRCDSCGTASPGATTTQSAHAVANIAGWRIAVHQRHRDLCPTCRRTERREIAALLAAGAGSTG